MGPPSLVRVFAIAEDEKPARLWPVLELELEVEGFSAYQCAFTPDSRTLILIDHAVDQIAAVIEIVAQLNSRGTCSNRTLIQRPVLSNVCQLRLVSALARREWVGVGAGGVV